MIRCFCILSFVLLVTGSFGQTNNAEKKIRKSNIQFRLGAVHSRMIDEGYTDSKLLFRGTTTKFSIGYGQETDHYIFNASVAGSVGTIKSRSGDLPSDFYFAEPTIEYLRKVTEYTWMSRENKLFAGIRLSSTNYGAYNLNVVDNVSFFSLDGIYFNLTDRLILNEKQALQVTYSMPAFVYTNRILWDSGANRFAFRDLLNFWNLLSLRGRSYFFAVSQNVQLNVTYSLQIGQKTRAEIDYKFVYLSNSIEAPVHIYSNELLFGLKVHL